MAVQRKREVPRIIAVAGGKGGVGKSTIAVNLALALGRLGHRVTLVDADLGAANLHTMLGLLNPAAGLADFLDHRVETLEALKIRVLLPTRGDRVRWNRVGAARVHRMRRPDSGRWARWPEHGAASPRTAPPSGRSRSASSPRR